MNEQAGTIVVGVDGSDSSERALDWAVDQAVLDRRPLTLVHATAAVSPAWIDQAIVDVARANELMRKEAHALLDRMEVRVRDREPEVAVTKEFRVADPREVFLDMSESAAMIVLGSRGRGRVRRLLLGSVGVALVRHAGCPVVVHRPGNPGVVRNGIVVGADGSAESRPVLEFAYRQAALRDLPLTVLHSFWDIQAASLETVVATGPTDAQEERLLLAESMAGLAEKYPEVRTRTEIVRGMAEEALVEVAERMNLLVVGAHQESRAMQLLYGSVSVAVVEQATCPVAVVPLSTR